jgi:hypothetical protein
MKKTKATKVIKKLENTTFDGVKKKNMFDKDIVLGAVMEDSIGILLTSNKEASKIILQIGKDKISLNASSLNFLTRATVTLGAMLAAQGNNDFRESLIEDALNKEESYKKIQFCTISGASRSNEEVIEQASLITDATDFLVDENVIKNDLFKKANDKSSEEVDFAEFLSDHSLSKALDEENTEEIVSDKKELLIDELLYPKEFFSDPTESEEITEEEATDVWAEDFSSTYTETENNYENLDKYELEAEAISSIEEDMAEGPMIQEEDNLPEDIAFDEEDQSEQGGFLQRMEELENMLTGNFEKPEEEIPTFEKIEQLRAEHGELAAKEYVSSLSQEQREALMKDRLKIRQAALEANND